MDKFSQIVEPYNKEKYQDYIIRIISLRQNVKNTAAYQELHHILPRCQGGDDNKDNLIWLYAQEHYYAHKLLALENPMHLGLVFAWWSMCHENKNDKYFITADEYAQLKEVWAINRTGFNHPRSKPVFCIETKQTYGSIEEAHRETGISANLISAVCRKLPGNNTAGGYHWLFEKDVTEENIRQTLELKRGAEVLYKQVICLNNLQVFKSITEAAKFANINDSGIRAYLYGRCHFAGRDENNNKLYWEYYSDYLNKEKEGENNGETSI